MSTSDQTAHNPQPTRWRYVFLALVVFVSAAVLLGGLWSLPRLVPGLAIQPSTTPLPPTATPSPTPVSLAIHQVWATADEEAKTLSFRVHAIAPPERPLAEAILWYDTESGRTPLTLPLSSQETVQLAYTATLATEGFTTTLTSNELDYWWLVRDTAGQTQRRGAVLQLSPGLADEAVPPTPEPVPADFAWSTQTHPHIAYYYPPGSAAERDLDQIAQMAEGALAYITPTLHTDVQNPLSVYLVPRLFWQGGAAYGGDTLLVSYLDRNYTGVETWTYFAHESVHALAHDWLQPKEKGGPDGVLVEGLAVWATGGHYYLDPIDQWAGAIAASEQFIPLYDLRTGDFYYDYQHEIAYHESASFVKFMIERNGLGTFRQLYGQANHDPAHDEELVQRLYGTGYAELEAEWLSYLSSLPPDRNAREAWWLTVRFFDLMRLYQTELDAPARTLPADTPPDWDQDLLQAFLHRAQDPVNRLLETALISAHQAIRAGDHQGASMLMDEIEASVQTGGQVIGSELGRRKEILDLLEQQDRAVLRADVRAFQNTLDPSLRADLGTAVEAQLQAYAYIHYDQEPVALSLDREHARAQAQIQLHAKALDGPHPDDGRLFFLTFLRQGDGWLMTSRQPYRPMVPSPPTQEQRGQPATP
jgi:hypothetical protein